MGELSRRSFISAGAAALGAGAAASMARAAGAPPAATAAERALGRLGACGATIELQRPADLVGVAWSSPARASVRLRFTAPGGAWSPWVSAGLAGHAPDSARAPQRLVGEPIWTGGTTLVQIRPDRELNGVSVLLVDASDGEGARNLAGAAAAASLALAAPVLDAGAGQPPIIARRAWAHSSCRPASDPQYGAVRMAFVHHTDSPNGYTPGEVPAMLRSIYTYHRYFNGWNDIGYNFVIDLFGRAFEARAGGIDEPVVGAHAGGFNLYSSGIAMLGSFSQTSISAAARATLERLLAWKLSLHGVPAEGEVTVRVNPAGAVYSRFPAGAHVPLPRIAGHRDADTTECPGGVLYGELGAIRSSAAQLAGEPSRVSIELGAVAVAPTAEAPTQQTVGGVLQTLTGAPLAGAPILVQQRSVSARGETVSEQTLAAATTDAEGRWSTLVPSPAGRAIALRALCPGQSALPASVSEALALAPSSAPAAPTAPSAPAPAPPAAPAAGGSAAPAVS